MYKALFFTLLIALGAASANATAPRYMDTNRHWDRLPDPEADGPRATLEAAAKSVGSWTLRLAGVTVDADTLAELASSSKDEPLVRVVRERLGRPVDVADFLLLLDDILVAGEQAPPGWTIYLPSGRARGAGILLHPDEVFSDKPRDYGGGRLAVYKPERPADLEPAKDGAPLGPRWTARYRNPLEEKPMLDALEDAGAGDFAQRIDALLSQLRDQGAEAYLFSTVRSRERGYLIYGAFILSRAESKEQLTQRVHKLQRLNREWELHVPIQWRHPDGWQATVRAAGEMANAYNVVYATQRGARYSSHYDGGAADFAAMDLPRRLTLKAPDGDAQRSFDLSAPDHPRDLNLSPALIRWAEEHFDFDKLRSDYPHWTDAAGR